MRWNEERERGWLCFFPYVEVRGSEGEDPTTVSVTLFGIIKGNPQGLSGIQITRFRIIFLAGGGGPFY